MEENRKIDIYREKLRQRTRDRMCVCEREGGGDRYKDINAYRQLLPTNISTNMRYYNTFIDNKKRASERKSEREREGKREGE